MSDDSAAPRHAHWFHVDAVRADLRSRSVRSGAIAVGGRGSLIVLNVASVMVLARVLRPEDFGVLAMVLPITVLYIALANHALQTSVIHDEHLDHARASAVFRAAALRNLLLAALLAAGGPVLARLYDDARAAPIAAAWAAVLYLASLSAVHEALLKRQLRFGALTTAHVAGLVVGIGVAIAAALLGAAHWALLLQYAIMDGFRALAAWKICDWRPAWRGVRAADAAGMHAYWRDLASFRAVTWLADHPDRILVGYVGGAATLGYYDSARRWAFYPFVELFRSLSDVAVATFSRVAHDPERYRAFVARGLLPVLALPLPAIAFLGVEARRAVLLLLGDQWLAAVPFVRLMCAAAFVGSIGRITPWLFLSRGETARQLRWAVLVQAPIMLASVLVGTRFGATGVATGFTIGTCLVALPGLAWALHGSPLRVGDVLRIAGRPAFASLAAAAVLWQLDPLLPALRSLVPGLVVRGAAFAAVYVAVWLALPGGRRAAREVLDGVRSVRAPRPGAVLDPRS